MDQLDAFDVARLLHFNSKDQMEQDEVEAWIELECRDYRMSTRMKPRPPSRRLGDALPNRRLFWRRQPLPSRQPRYARCDSSTAQASMGFASVWNFERRGTAELGRSANIARFVPSGCDFEVLTSTPTVQSA